MVLVLVRHSRLPSSTMAAPDPPSCEAYSMRERSYSAHNIETTRIVCDDPARVSKIRWRMHDADGDRDFVATFACASHHARRISEVTGRDCAPRAVASNERRRRETRGRETGGALA